MIEAVDRQKAVIKSFKRKVEVVDSNNLPDNVTPIGLQADSLESPSPASFMDKLESMIKSQNEVLQEIAPLKESAKVRVLPARRVINWDENRGRFALAETFLKQNQAEFMVIKNRMQQMADSDGCGGVNESRGLKNNVVSISNNVISLNENGLQNLQKKSHKEGEHSHCKKCEGDLDESGKCGKCAA